MRIEDKLSQMGLTLPEPGLCGELWVRYVWGICCLCLAMDRAARGSTSRVRWGVTSTPSRRRGGKGGDAELSGLREA
jgi:hypothetical protein